MKQLFNAAPGHHSFQLPKKVKYAARTFLCKSCLIRSALSRMHILVVIFCHRCKQIGALLFGPRNDAPILSLEADDLGNPRFGPAPNSTPLFSSCDSSASSRLTVVSVQSCPPADVLHAPSPLAHVVAWIDVACPKGRARAGARALMRCCIGTWYPGFHSSDILHAIGYCWCEISWHRLL